MKRTFSIILLLIINLSIAYKVIGQNTRITDSNSIGWYNYFGTLKLNDRFSIHTEYQWRRNNLITDWQQSLLRLGVNYQVNSAIQLRMGYGWIETFAYGEFPLNAFGKTFTEHRLFQVATLSNKVETIEFSHRFMVEQRWIGRYSAETLTKEDEYLFTNRIRYLFRLQLPLKGKTIGDHTPYLAAYDELFIGFGENVNENIFDQNRASLLIGYKINSVIRIEAGYLNQILQLGREIDSRNVFQYNHGVLLNTYVNINLTNQSRTKD